MKSFVITGKASQVFRLIELKAIVERLDEMYREKTYKALRATIDEMKFCGVHCPFSPDDLCVNNIIPCDKSFCPIFLDHNVEFKKPSK